AIGPPAGGDVEDEVSFRPVVDRCCVTIAVRLTGRALRRAGGDDLESRNRRRIAVPFPAHQARYPVPGFHARAGEEPVVRAGADPVRSARDRACTMRADQLIAVRSLVSERLHFFKLKRSPRRPKDADALEGAAALVEEDPPA